MGRPAPLLPIFQQPGESSSPPARQAASRQAPDFEQAECRQCQMPGCGASIKRLPHQDARYCSPHHRRAARSLRRHKQIAER